MSAYPGDGIFEMQDGNDLLRFNASSDGRRVKIETPDGAKVVGPLLERVYHTMCRPPLATGTPNKENGIIECLACSKHCQLGLIIMMAVSKVTASQQTT